MLSRSLKLFLLILGLVMLQVLVGCAQSSQPTKQEPAPANVAATPAPAEAPAAKPPQKITISYSAVSMTWLPIKVAIDKGFFQDEGLVPEMIQMKGNVATTALVSGDTDFTVNISPVLNGAMQGMELKLVAALNTRPLFTLMVRPEIKTTDDLKGKVFAVNAFGNTQAILTEKHLQALGLQEKDYQLIAVGATGARLATMEQNSAQGSLMPVPTNVQMENNGYRMMGKTSDYVVQPVVGLGTNETKIKNQRDMVKNTIRAAMKGLQFVHNNKDETIKVMMDWVKVDAKDGERAYELAKEGFGKDGFVSDEDLKIEWELLQKATEKTDVPVSAATDFSMLLEVQKELGIK